MIFYTFVHRCIQYLHIELEPRGQDKKKKQKCRIKMPCFPVHHCNCLCGSHRRSTYLFLYLFSNSSFNAVSWSGYSRTSFCRGAVYISVLLRFGAKAGTSRAHCYTWSWRKVKYKKNLWERIKFCWSWALLSSGNSHLSLVFILLSKYLFYMVVMQTKEIVCVCVQGFGCKRSRLSFKWLQI